jgi:hypothetical protein
MNYLAVLPRPPAAFAAVLAAFFVTGCASYFESRQGSGHPTTSTRAVASFSRIELSGAPDLDVVIGSPASVTVNTDDNLQPIIETTVANDTLRIRPTHPYSSPYGCIVTVTIPSLASLSACGSGTVHVANLSTDKFTLAVVGSSEIGLTGNVTDADFSLKGSGSIVAPDLVTQNLKLVLHGSGHALVHATGTLDVQLTGSGYVHYVGQPTQIQRQLTGSGSLAPQ